MKRILCLILSVLLILSLCACGNKDNATNETTHSVPENETISQPTDEKAENIITTKPTEEVVKNTEIKLSFVGDMMIACYKDQTTSGSFNEYTNNNPPSYFLEKVKPIFENDDFTVGNLETVLSDSEVSPVSKNHNPAYWFKAKTSNTDILTSSSVECVSLSNNHTNDYGKTGYNDTIEAVKKANLNYGNDEQIMYVEKEGYKIAIICTGLWGEYAATNISKRIKEAEEVSDYQIIFFHGGTERLHKPEDWKVRACRKLVDNGADLVIGAHPHVLQPKETYNGVDIVYSLGNFCYGGHRRPENRTIIYQAMITVDKDKNVVNFASDIIPCYVYTGNVNNYQPTPIENQEEITTVLDFMDSKRELPY